MGTVYFTVPPVPASRPRVTRYGTYYGKRYTEFRKQMQAAVENSDYVPLAGKLIVTICLYVGLPKTKTKRLWPGGDVDNYSKGVLDALNGVLWEDDDQIVKLIVTKQWSDIRADGPKSHATRGEFSVTLERG